MIGKRPYPAHKQKEAFTMRAPFSRLAKVKRFPALVAALVFLVALAGPAAAEDGDWSEFVFDSSSDSYKVRGERAFDLRSGRYSATASSRTRNSDLIKFSGFNPEWVTLISGGRRKVLFSFGAANDPKVEEKAERISNCVPIPYGGSYVASFDDGAYTIKLVEGSYDFPAGYAKFLYKSGGTPGPEHEPLKASRQGGRTPRTGPAAESSGDRDYEEKDEEDRIGEVTIIVSTPEPSDDDSPRSYPLSLSMNTSYEGGFSSKNRMNLGVKEGSEEIYTFTNVRPATYSVKITYGDKTITDTVVIDDGTTRIRFEFE